MTQNERLGLELQNFTEEQLLELLLDFTEAKSSIDELANYVDNYDRDVANAKVVGRKR